MKKRTRQSIEEYLESIEKRLADAEDYIRKNVNIEGTAFLHFDDWRGKSGHPLWMKNFMIPALMKRRAQAERALQKLDDRAKDQNLTRVRRNPAT